MTNINDNRTRIQTTIRQTLHKNGYQDHFAETRQFDGYTSILRTKSNNGYSLLIKNHEYTYSKPASGQPLELTIQYNGEPIYQSAIHTKCESFDVIVNVSPRNLYIYLSQMEKWTPLSHLNYKPF